METFAIMDAAPTTWTYQIMHHIKLGDVSTRCNVLTSHKLGGAPGASRQHLFRWRRDV